MAESLHCSPEIITTLLTGYVVLSHFSHVQLCDPVDCSQAPPSVGFSRQEYWSGLPGPPPEDLPDPGIEPASLALQGGSLMLSHWGSPLLSYMPIQNKKLKKKKKKKAGERQE